MPSFQLFDASVNVPHHADNLLLVLRDEFRVLGNGMCHLQELFVNAELRQFFFQLRYFQLLTLNLAGQFVVLALERGIPLAQVIHLVQQ